MGEAETAATHSLASDAVYLTMSNQQEGNYVDRVPLSKREKYGGGDEKAFGGPMYDEATARKMLEEVVLQAGANGEAPVIGFDPDDAALDDAKYMYAMVGAFRRVEMTPVMYFAHKGDAKMCRYLVSRGASTTKSRLDGLGPMYLAAQRGHLEVCKLLYENGASHDIWRENATYGWTPFHIAAHKGHDEVVRWLVLQGALCANANFEEIEGDRIFPVAYGGHVRDRISRQCERLVAWAEEVAQSHSALVTFFLGTQPRAPDKDQNRTLQCMSGHPGVRKHIGDFVGLEVTKGKQLRILRSMVDVLPSFIED